jgi:hypothetical protein
MVAVRNVHTVAHKGAHNRIVARLTDATKVDNEVDFELLLTERLQRSPPTRISA